VGEAEIQYRRYRTLREVTSQFDVPTSLTPAPKREVEYNISKNPSVLAIQNLSSSTVPFHQPKRHT
jgi:hypothetical protein